MYLFFDTETTGLPLNWQAPPERVNNWPRIVQIAYLFADEKLNVVGKGNHIIRPEGYTISDEAAGIHGITTEMATEKGQPMEVVIGGLVFLLHKHRPSLVAHNIAYDYPVFVAEAVRLGFPSARFAELKRFCTMKSSTGLCKLPGSYGFKWPKLEELHQFLFGVGLDGAHDALADIEATYRCFVELRKRGAI